MRQFISGVAIAALLAAATTVDAQQGVDPTTLSLEDLMATPVEHVVGASKFLQKVSDAPSAVTIITADEIRLYGYRTLADVLRSIEGISISYDRNYSYLGMRGLSRPGDLNSRVLVLVDGHRMNNNVDGQVTLGTDFQIDVDLIDRVEVIRGPSAALYGSAAFAAVIAVVTRTGTKVDGAEAALTAASYGTTRARATWGTRTARGVDLLVSGTTYRSEGQARLFFPEFASPDSNGGYAEHEDGERADSFTASAGLGHFRLLGVYASRRKQVPTASYSTVFNSGREETSDSTLFFDMQYTRELGQSVELLVRAYADRRAYTGHYPYAGESGEADALVVSNLDQFRGLWWGGEVDVSRRVGQSHIVTGGTEVRHNIRQSTLNYDEDPFAVYIDERPRTYSVALTLQDEYIVSHRLRFNLAGRAERLPTGESGIVPKLAVIYVPAGATTMKLLFSRALRAPTIYELYYDSPANSGNPDLTAERMEALELNVEHYLTPAMRIEASIYRNVYRNLIVEVPDASGAVGLQNGLDARAPGFETSWTMKRQDGLQLRASYSTLFDADAASQAWTSGAPKHLAKVSVGGPLTRLGVTVGTEVQYESRRHTHSGDILPPSAVANLNVGRRNLLKHVDLNVSLTNVFDAQYSEPVSENHRQGAIAQDGRQIFVGLTWRSK